MHNNDGFDGATSAAVSAGTLPFAAAADLQDHLMTATNDLDRLQTLLSDACDTLQSGFLGAAMQLQELRSTPQPDLATLESAYVKLSTAVSALQFQDMACQLITHTRGRLRNCADRIARDSFAGDDDGDAVIEEAPLRPNPVTQAEMDTGFIELF